MMKQINTELKNSQRSLRDQFGLSLKKIGSTFPNIVVLDADLSSSTKTKLFQDAFPDRFFNIGIAEQNMMGIAIGLANSGKIPVVSGFSCFTIPRSWELIRTAAYDQLPVKICTTHSGLSPAKDGGSHQSLEDIALISSIPNFFVYCPCDPVEVDQVLNKMININNPCYMRLMRSEMPWVFPEDYKFSDSFTELLYESNKKDVEVTIFSTGSMSCFTPKIVELVEKEQITIRVIHMGRIKPLNLEIIKKYIAKTKLIVTIEEHNSICGFGAQMAGFISQIKPTKMLIIGIEDEFGQSGTIEELYNHYGLTPEIISKKILNRLKSTDI